MKSVGVFCSASNKIDVRYFRAPHELGVWLGRNGIRLVYGGSCLGLMEEIARSANEAGGRVLGVVPSKLVEGDHVSSYNTEVINCNNLSDRKDIMFRESDLLLALPGGIGTVDEIFHVMGSATIGYHRKRMVLFNVEGYWNGLMDMLRGMQANGFINAPLETYVVSVDTIEELEQLISEIPDK